MVILVATSSVSHSVNQVKGAKRAEGDSIVPQDSPSLGQDRMVGERGAQAMACSLSPLTGV